MVKGRRWHRVGALVASAVAVMVAAGCTEDGSGGSGRTAASMLGELSTIEPCSLTDLAVLSPFGTAELDSPASSDACIVDLHTPSDARGLLWVGELDRVESHPNIDDKQARELPDGLKVVDYQDGSNYCTRLLVFPDAVTLSVRFQLYIGNEPNMKMCDVVSAAIDRVVEVVRSGVKHRTYPAGSLATIDPCAVTPADAAAALPQLRDVKPKSRPSKHVCTWSTADDKTRIKVDFSTIVARHRPLGSGVRQTIADRASAVVRAPLRCSAETVHIPFAVGGQADLVEIARVDVDVPVDQASDGAKCDAAIAVATVVWPKLPRTVT